MEEKEKNALKMNKTIQKTIAIILEKTKELEKTDYKKAEKINEKLENLYEDINNKNINAFEVLNELLKIQNELIMSFDTDVYMQKSTQEIYPVENVRVDKVLQINIKKENVFYKILKRIFLIGKEASSLPENTTMINQIAQVVSQRYESSMQDARKPVYDFFLKMKRNEYNQKRIYLEEDNKKENYIEIADGNKKYYKLKGEKQKEAWPLLDDDNDATIKLLLFSEFLNGMGENDLKLIFLDALEKDYEIRDALMMYRREDKFRENAFKSDIARKYIEIVNQAETEFEKTYQDFYSSISKKENVERKSMRESLRIVDDRNEMKYNYKILGKTESIYLEQDEEELEK